MESALTAIVTAIKTTAAFAALLVYASLVPGDEAYYQVEDRLSHLGPLGAMSRHIRSVPTTAASLIFEVLQGNSLEVEGVEVDLDQAVNPTENVRQGTFSSPALGEERTYWVYLPPGYQKSEEHYPVLYLLHGMSQGHEWWTQVARVDRIATSMIASDKIRPLIIVMPNGNRVEQDVSTTSLYDDHCRSGLDVIARTLKALGDRFQSLQLYKISCEGNFEDYIVEDVVAEIDSKYRTNGERYVGGFSVGGRGAMQLALGHPAVFNGAFGLSGNYDYLRGALRAGDISPNGVMRLFLASGDRDQRGVYGELNTFLFHRELTRMEIGHLYCTYRGTHSDMAWVSAIPAALMYMLTTSYPNQESACAGVEIG